MKSQQHVFLQQEGQISSLHQRSCYRGCFYNCKKSPYMLPSTCVSGWPLLPLGVGNYVSCRPARQYYDTSPSFSCAEKDTACPWKRSERATKLLTMNVWRRACMVREQKPSTGYQHRNNPGDRWQFPDNTCEMVKSVSQNCWRCLATVLSNKWGW